MRRILAAVVVAMVLAPPVVAEHGPFFDVSCPTGTAQVVLDPGHGGPDPGAVKETYGLHEAVLNLEIATRTAAILQDEHGYTAALTRDDNETELGNSERGAIANACEALVFVSIHLNASTDLSANYTQAFWAEKEKDLALSVVMNEALGALGIPVNTVDRFDNGGLLRARMPAVLVEAVFLSNDEEAARLADGSRQEEIAQAIAAGIASWLALGNHGDGLDASARTPAHLPPAMIDAISRSNHDGVVRAANAIRPERAAQAAIADGPPGILDRVAGWGTRAARNEVNHA